MADSEVAVLTKVLEAMSELDEAGSRRVVSWLIDKYGLPRDAGAAGRHFSAKAATAPSAAVAADDFAAFYADAAPTTDKDRALVAGYWTQVVKGESDLDSFALNRELTNLGHRVGNITKALSHLMNDNPQLVIQTRKSGGSKQARKKYRLSRAGIKAVEDLIGRGKAPE
jgi:hypothetical protein